jgi:hypothetical protein
MGSRGGAGLCLCIGKSHYNYLCPEQYINGNGVGSASITVKMILLPLLTTTLRDVEFFYPFFLFNSKAQLPELAYQHLITRQCNGQIPVCNNSNRPPDAQIPPLAR